ncbi:hypothetical protein [Aliiglaciecola litoralis]|uniref:Alpha/beta hydrolase n=1 Tax=Aliiglaciecola litoralis TaxID=582857 RepID=A0ABN1LC31_9ALTE
MDGTGKLFGPIISLLPETIVSEVIPLSSLKEDDAISQANEIAQRIGNEQIVIFAESYSGIIAYQLCQMSSLNIKHVFFAASFLYRPSHISKFAYLAPISIIRLNLIPKFFLSWILFGSWYRKDLVGLFLQSLEQVSNATLKKRLKIISSLIEPNNLIQTPCTYLQAKKDKLVSKYAVIQFQKICVNLNIKKLDGGHFIAQSNPQKCVEVICAEYSL